MANKTLTGKETADLVSKFVQDQAKVVSEADRIEGEGDKGLYENQARFNGNPRNALKDIRERIVGLATETTEEARYLSYRDAFVRIQALSLVATRIYGRNHFGC